MCDAEVAPTGGYVEMAASLLPHLPAMALKDAFRTSSPSLKSSQCGQDTHHPNNRLSCWYR